MILQEVITQDLQHYSSPIDMVEHSLTREHLRLFIGVREWVRKNQIHLYLVGGAIRDSFLGYPVTDLDFTYEGDAIGLAQDLVSNIEGEIVVHRRFGTATISIGDVRIDLASCRSETYPSQGQLPLVSQGDIQKELLRRDFTINALAIPLWEDSPDILDLSGGIADLRDNKIKVLHDKSFVDDPTRLFRAVKYEQRFDFQIDDHTTELMNQSIRYGSISFLSGDRIRHEFERIFAEPNPSKALGRLSDTGVLDSVFPGLVYKSPVNLDSSSAPSSEPDISNLLMRYIVSLSLCLSNDKRQLLIQRLNMPREWIKVISDIATIESALGELTTNNIKPSKIYSLLEGVSVIAITEFMELNDSIELTAVLSDYLTRLGTVTMSISGSDVIARGVHPGPIVGLILRRLLLCKLDGGIATFEEELEMLNTILGDESIGSG